MLAAGEKDKTGDSPDTGIGPGIKGKNPNIYTPGADVY